MNDLQSMDQKMKDIFPAWRDFSMWVEDTRTTISTERARTNFDAQEFTFGRVLDEVQELNDRMGKLPRQVMQKHQAGLAKRSTRTRVVFYCPISITRVDKGALHRTC